MSHSNTFPLGIVRTGDHPSLIDYTCVSHEMTAGVNEYRFTFRHQTDRAPAPVVIEWKIPLLDTVGKWHPLIAADRSLTSGWCTYIQSYATRSAPVYTLFSEAGENRQTFALSDAINPISTRIQVEEDTAEIKCEVVLFDAPSEPISEYQVTLRIDNRQLPYHESLADISDWWAAMEEYRPAAVPESAFDPVYSTWYSYHQELTEEEIEQECKWSKELGCDSVIVDDGWQTDDSNKGYQFCGDWEIATSKFPGFTDHVKRVQEMNMRYLLWFSVPYAGRESEAWKTFRDRVLPKAHANADCLDPRFPKVRQYLIDLYRKAVEDWGLDGLKLDFVDQFTAEALSSSEEETHDMVSVPCAADRLLSDMSETLQKVRPDVLIEFRQRYIGPAMRKYGNILRAQDCPNDALSNRVRTIDVRLLAGNTAVHSDMIMWHREETVERVSQQLWASLFAVPQISVRGNAIPPEHEKALQFFLRFWKNHRDCLVHGELQPLEPQLLYPVVIARSSKETIAAVYQSGKVVQLPELNHPLYLINASADSKVYLDTANLSKTIHYKIFDCTGSEVRTDSIQEAGPILTLPVPPSGLVEIRNG